jgi:glutamate-1-semialdehyde 2,1-aminomutase
MNKDLYIYIPLAGLALFIFRKSYYRLQLSFAKHPSLRGHSKWSRRIASMIRFFDYGEVQFFCSDGAPGSIVQTRRQGLERLKQLAKNRSPNTIAFSASLEDSVSDVRFTTAYRVPFPYRNYLSKELRLGSIVEETQGVKVRDLDDNWRYDLTGSYGVNVFGYDFYKDCMERGFEKVKPLGPVLGSYHPVIRENVEKLKKISGLDEVSFHMSGTEAVMQAVRLARYHTGRTHLVRLCGAYHGWWDGVQPGIGNQRQVNDVYTLSDLSPTTLKVLETRNDIACVLINPLQALHPNSDAASDASLINSDRSAYFDREHYTNWLKQIRDVCNRKNIVLIFDEVFTGFRLGYRGAQGYFDVQADMVTYGKTLGGGLPVGVVCGRHDLMKRFRDDSPINVSFARGTFNSHPYVMGSMNEFLNRIEQPEFQEIYHQSDELWNLRFAQLNERLLEKKLPVKIANLHSICTILYTVPSRYNWMLQFYLRSEGLEMSWIGSGRMIMSLNFTDEDFIEVMERFIRAAESMNQNGWWWQSPQLTNKSIKRQILKEMIAARFPKLGRFLEKPTLTGADETIKGAQ